MTIPSVQRHEEECSVTRVVDCIVSLCKRIMAIVIACFDWIAKFLHTLYRYFVPEPVSESLLSHPLNPRVYEQALKILGLSIQQSQDNAIIEPKYARLIQVYTERQRILKSLSPTLAEEFGRWIRDAHIAYHTVMQHVPTEEELFKPPEVLRPNILDID